MMNPVVYAAEQDGDLVWLRHVGQNDGSFRWEGPTKVGTGWSAYERIFSGGDGVIYGVTRFVEGTVHITSGATPGSGGDLVWLRHVGRSDGTFRWDGPRTVGRRWGFFTNVFPGGGGVIYGVRNDGALMWYRHLGREDGSFRWEGPKQVGTGWGEFTQIFSGGDGVIYAVKPNGELIWLRHVGREDGTFRWEGPKTVGRGWGVYTHVFSAGDGVIYGVEAIVEASVHVVGGTTGASGGNLVWFRHAGRADGSFRWEGPKRVGRGWGAFIQVFSGYDTTLGKAKEAINAKWSAIGGAPGSPGISGDESYVAAGDGFYRQYAHGRIYYREGVGAFWVHGLIGDRYIQLGASNGWLGWPTSEEQPFTDDGRVSTFQNGAIYWWPNTGPIEMGNVLVRYSGLVCFGETDDQIFSGSTADEPYVVLGVVPVVPGQQLTTRTRIFDNVDAGDSREDSLELYRGAPYGLALGVVAMEHDLADPEKYREVIRVGVDKAAAAVKIGVGFIPFVGPFLGPVAEQFLKAVAPDIVEAVNDGLGLGDDLIGKLAWTITAKDMVTMARAGQRNFKGVLYKMESQLIDQGDGAYKVYLDIEALPS